eukprot:SAG31_NODE_31138_length_371_cov_2.227941_1_plen_29_part_10
MPVGTRTYNHGTATGISRMFFLKNSGRVY